MVASTHWLAAGTGMAMLEHGGNAFDAAVAAGFVLQVVEPHLNGPGGEVPILASSADGDVVVVNGQGPTPAAATVARFTGLGLELIPGTGLLPACVPGAFDAWMRLLAELGTLPLREVLTPAIGYAAGGYPVATGLAAAIRQVAPLFREHWPTSAAVYLAGGPPEAGARFRNPDLAATYARVLAEAEAATADRDGQIAAARDAFYRGFVAEAIDAFSSGGEVADATGRRHRGLLTGEDLARHDTPLEAPVRRGYRGYTVCKTQSWGQGPVFCQQLALLEGFDLPAMAHLSTDFVHTVVESAKLAFADREAWYGDPAFADVPLDTLLGDAYAAQRRALVGATASAELRPGAPDGRPPRMPPAVRAVPPGVGAGDPSLQGDTCHVSAGDRWGNLVAATPSGGWLQSSPVVPGLGFSLGTRAQMMWLTEGLANTLAPGKRPRTTLSPSLALRDGEAYLAFGTPGGDQQDQWSLVFFLAHVDAGLDLQAAIDAPAFHTTAFPSSFYPRTAEPRGLVVEGRIGSGVVADLRRRGHAVTVAGDWSLGRLSAVGREPGRLLKAAADPRGTQGYAVGR
ncbi:MAG TPA: gamma-glutamyltransferase family protein [Egibacteraceae bacterium]|nr:gamma-glutamyltransferase family protein [Egibacteraceae bacterium]